MGGAGGRGRARGGGLEARGRGREMCGWGHPTGGWFPPRRGPLDGLERGSGGLGVVGHGTGARFRGWRAPGDPTELAFLTGKGPLDRQTASLVSRKGGIEAAEGGFPAFVGPE
jgi:hypothetical protein